MVKKRRSRTKRNVVVLSLLAVIAVAGAVALYNQSHGPGNNASGPIRTGDSAPDFPIALLSGGEENLSQFRGQTVLLWFVTTWCSSCQEGAQLLSQQYYTPLHSKGVVILTVELYNNLGQPGPSMSQFEGSYGGGPKAGWLYGTAPQWVTYRYDPNAYLDIFYLVNPQGMIVDTNVGLPNYLGSIVSQS